MKLLRFFSAVVLAAAWFDSAAAGQSQLACPTGQAQDTTGKCVSAASLQQPTDACAARGMVLKGSSCVKPCPTGTNQGPAGNCVKTAQ